MFVVTIFCFSHVHKFFRVSGLGISARARGNFMLTPLTITDLSPYFKAPFPGFSLILNFEIVTRNGRLTCVLKGVVIPEQRCLDEIQHVTQPDVDFPVQQELKKEIIKNTTSGSTYIVMDNDKFKAVWEMRGKGKSVTEWLAPIKKGSNKIRNLISGRGSRHYREFTFEKGKLLTFS